jgi:hypothetical protein
MKANGWTLLTNELSEDIWLKLFNDQCLVLLARQLPRKRRQL